MIEEMNEVRDLYLSEAPIEDVLRECVCQRHGHQYCIPSKAVDDAIDALLKGEFVFLNKVNPFVQSNRLYEGFADFEQLYDFVASVIAGISGIGPLTVYDTAKRIGHLFANPIYPQQYVYLSGGAMDGAKALLGTNNLKFREPAGLFEPYFKGLSSVFIEDILCIFKSTFASLGGATVKSVLKQGNCVFHAITEPTVI